MTLGNPKMLDINKIVKITFQDHGQDLLEWTLENGVVVDCEPAQGFFWNGCKLLAVESGERAQVERKGVKMTVKYPVDSIESVEHFKIAEVPKQIH